jgi:hypothetical protein
MISSLMDIMGEVLFKHNCTRNQNVQDHGILGNNDKIMCFRNATRHKSTDPAPSSEEISGFTRVLPNGRDTG